MYHAPDRELTGTVCAMEAPRAVPVVPLAVLKNGLIVSAPVAAVVIRPPASSTYIFPGRES
jgi:hypothetical protein